MFDSKTWRREALERHSVDTRQFIDFRQSTLANGMRLIEAYNSSGLAFTILPDRGLDIWTAHYKGVPLTWISQGSPHPPDFGQPWLQQFNGGLLTTCGLTHVGPPEQDAITGEVRDIHGKYSRLRAGDCSVSGWWGPEDEEYSLVLRGVVAEATLFGSQLKLERRYELALGKPAIQITDHVTNLGDAPVPLMLLYHFNLGYPLISEGTQFVLAHDAVYPRDDAARAGFVSWADYDPAQPGYAEQVFFHHVKCQARSDALPARAEVALIHGDFGLSFVWDTEALPYLTQWKNTRQGIYVSGIEPGNCIPEGQNAARQNKRLKMLKPGEIEQFSCCLTVLDGAEAVNDCKRRIAELQQRGVPADGCHLEDYAEQR